MPMDMVNPPGQRNPPFRDGDSGGGLDSGLRIENMLLEEYNYAATTAYQAMEDRARMFNMYLLVVGILGSAFGAIYPLGGAVRSFIQPIAVVVLFAAGVAGVAFFVLLIRLRQAFRQSLITMAVIKEFYIREFRQQIPTIQHVFRKLLRKGITAEVLEKVHAPVGLDLGAKTPDEIALSIAAELLRWRRHASGESLREHASILAKVLSEPSTEAELEPESDAESEAQAQPATETVET